MEFCAVCRASISLSTKLCTSCRDKLNNENLTLPIRKEKFLTRSLYSWAENDNFLSTIVYSLKGRRSNGLCEFFCRNMSMMFGDLNKRYCFVFVESSTYGKDSHGMNLAKNLGMFFRAPIMYIPFSQKSGSQKLKNIEDRAKVTCKKSFYTDLIGPVDYVFVDDVVTTGATSMAVFRGLGFPQRYQVWSVFDRPIRDCSAS